MATKHTIVTAPRCISAVLVLMFFLLTSCGGSKSTKGDEAFDPEKSIAKAETLIDGKSYDEARKLLTEVKNRDTTKQYSPLAQLKIADSYIKEQEVDPGIEEYRKFLEMYPDNSYAPYAQYQIGMAYFSQITSPDRGAGVAQKALQEFVKLKELYPRNPYREVLGLRIDKCRTVIADGDFLIGEFYYKKGSYNAAIGRLEGLLNKYPDYKRKDEALLLLGRSYRELKQNDKAREIFKELIEKYPSSKLISAAKKEHLKSGGTEKQ